LTPKLQADALIGARVNLCARARIRVYTRLVVIIVYKLLSISM